MIYCVENDSMVIYEARPFGTHILVRPAKTGEEHYLERLTMMDFNARFNIFLAKFLIPDLMTAEDNERLY